MIVLYANIFTFGVIFNSAVYHFMVSLGRNGRQRKIYFYFSMILFDSLLIMTFVQPAISSVFVTDQLKYVYYPILNMLKLGMIIVSYQFFRYTFHKHINKYMVLGLASVYCVDLFSMISFLITGKKKIGLIRSIFPSNGILSSIIIAIIILLLLGNIIRLVIKERKISYILFFVSFIIAILYLSLVNSNIFLLPDLTFFKHNYAGFIVIIQIVSFALSSEFNKEHKELVDLKDTLEHKVIRRTVELQEANHQKVNYFVNLAHETKTPLTVINNYLDQYIKRNGITPEIQIIKDNIEKLKNDMINFLDAQKLERNQVFYDNSLITGISDVLNSRVELFSHTASHKKIELKTGIDPGLFIKVDPAALDRIINNLLDNSIKYTGDDGSIMIKLSGNNDTVVLEVNDTGIGMSEIQLEQIFLPYHQISLKKRNIQGIGMGLYITKMLVDSLSGQIDVTSIPDEGSSFKVTLPRYYLGNNDTITGKYEIKTRTTLSKELCDLTEKEHNNSLDTILVVEDNRELLSYMLGNLCDEYNVYISQNGQQALEKITAIPRPDVIISDVMMDVMDGHELFHKLHENADFRDIPFIFLTANSKVEERIEWLKEGALDYIYKPFSIDEIKARLISIIHFQRLKKQLHEHDKFVSIGQLTAGLCHEISNPLGLIYGPLELLEMELNKKSVIDNGDIDLYLQRISSNVSRIEKIVNTLKFFTNSKKPDYVPINVNKIIEVIKKECSDILPARIKLDFIIEESFDGRTDADSLNHILINLLTHVVSTLPDKGLITITFCNRDNQPCVLVQDNGDGINEDHLPFIFNACYVDDHQKGATSMALYFVHEIIKKLGWKISADSVVGEYTEFMITLIESK